VHAAHYHLCYYLYELVHAFDEQTIAVMEFWTFREKSYPYSSVAKIIETPHPISSSGPYPWTSFTIVFKDGYVGSSKDKNHTDLDIPKDAKAMEYVSQKAGIAITRANAPRSICRRIGPRTPTRLSITASLLPVARGRGDRNVFNGD